MTLTLKDRPAAVTSGSSGTPARRAMVRWAWRMFRREWRRQALILALLVVAVAATIVGLGIASNAQNLKADPTMGTANTIITLQGSSSGLSADIAAMQAAFGKVDVIAHQTAPIPGSISTVDIRAQDPNGPYGHVMLRLDSGRYPTGPGEVAVTHGVATTFGLHIGSRWTENGRTLDVVGIVENPLDLLDQFALVAPGQANPPTSVSVLVNASQAQLQSFRVPNGGPTGVESRGTGGRTQGEILVLVLGTLGMLFVGLLAVAGFTVMAQRRLRALGMLGSLGATDRHVRLVMLANGAAVGGTAAVVGAVIGLGAWIALVPAVQSVSEKRIDRFDLPWWAIGAAMLLTLVTAIVAAWWPARSVARMSVVAALSGRPAPPQPAHRFAALGGVVLATGIVLLAFADQNRVGFIIGGTVTTVVGLLFLAPLAIRVLAAAAAWSTVSVRLALRDLARYQARSGAALGAVTLAVGIAATIAISAAAAQTPTGPGNLPSNQMMLYVTPGGAGGPGLVPPLSPVQQQTLGNSVNQLAAAIHANAIVPLDQADDPRGGLSSLNGGGSGQPSGYPTASLAQVTSMPHGGQQISSMVNLYVATPAVLAHYGINPADILPTTDVLSGQGKLAGLSIFDPNQGRYRQNTLQPAVQTFSQLPAYTSAPGVLITNRAMQALGLDPIPAGWLVQTPGPLTSAQIQTARKTAATVGLYIETHSPTKSSAPLRNWSTAAGILVALGVLGMTVGLIRSETRNDLRILTAAGASSTTRRAVTAATAGAIAFLGALIGTGGAYAALLAWHRGNLTPLGQVPVLDLVLILVALPLLAALGAWLLAGREPRAISRQPLD